MSGSDSQRVSSAGPQAEDEREGMATSEDVVQSPERTAEFGHAVLSRLPLAPPLVVQLIVRDRDGSVIPIPGELPFLVAHLALLSENGAHYLDVPPDDSQRPIPLAQRLLYGTLASSPHPLQDQHGNPGIYFIFPDVSVRHCGRYRLRVSLLRISRPDSNLVMEAGTGTAIVSTRTRVFEVVPQAEYVAPATTSLTQSFHRQGARMYTPPSSTPSARR
ncbi:velvet factor [Ceratobasidium sp. AG-Ba]|nr:velvet factor [Ceratobasidium sp. AG-Ba]QRW02997.1 velvet factor [Ceratobasidium sp. AG-Ba]